MGDILWISDRDLLRVSVMDILRISFRDLFRVSESDKFRVLVEQGVWNDSTKILRSQLHRTNVMIFFVKLYENYHFYPR